MTTDTDETAVYALDDVDRGVLYALQRDARNVTTQEIGDEVNVSASTVRNRITNLEDIGVIESYQPSINYERAGYQLRVMFVATVPSEERSRLAEEALTVNGVVDVREMMTSTGNLFIEIIATNTRSLTQITERLNELGLDLVSSEIVVSHRSQPFGELGF